MIKVWKLTLGVTSTGEDSNATSSIGLCHNDTLLLRFCHVASCQLIALEI